MDAAKGRRCLAAELWPRTRYGLARPEPISGAAVLARIGGTDGRLRDELAGPSRSQPQGPVCLPIRWWVEILTLESRNRTIDGTFAPAWHPAQSIHCRRSKGETIGW